MEMFFNTIIFITAKKYKIYYELLITKTRSFLIVILYILHNFCSLNQIIRIHKNTKFFSKICKMIFDE